MLRDNIEFWGYGRFIVVEERPVDSAQNSTGDTNLDIWNKEIFSRVRDGESGRIAKDTRVATKAKKEGGREGEREKGRERGRERRSEGGQFK